MSDKTQQNLFSSKLGVIAATVGSAVGLGNVWRFPAETQANGGAAFLLVYVICVLLLGIPVMLAEFSLGRKGRSDAIGVFRKMSPGTKWWVIGMVAVVAAYLIDCFYMVVAGWTLEYFWASVSGGLFDGFENAVSSSSFFRDKMDLYVSTPLRPIGFTLLMVFVNAGVLLCGVQKGIEKLSNVLMPLLFVILVAMCCFAFTLPGASAGVGYFLSPDFGKITPQVVINGLGQAFFSLSLGMGILVTFAAYYPSNTNLRQTAVTVAALSLLVALLVGLTIFPAVMSFGLGNESLRGATLVFVTLPEVFSRLPWPGIWSALFFFLLLVAALTSTVSITEVSVAMLRDRFDISRTKAVVAVMLPLVFVSALCSLSFSSLEDLKIMGLTIFDFLDSFSTNVLLPVTAIGVCVYAGWFAPKRMLKEELTNYGSLKCGLNDVIIAIIRYAAPVLIAGILVFNLL